MDTSHSLLSPLAAEFSAGFRPGILSASTETLPLFRKGRQKIIRGVNDTIVHDTWLLPGCFVFAGNIDRFTVIYFGPFFNGIHSLFNML